MLVGTWRVVPSRLASAMVGDSFAQFQGVTTYFRIRGFIMVR